MERADILRQMIADYQKKIELYRAMISEWEVELGQSLAGSGNVVATATGTLGEEKKNGGPSPLWMVKEWQFFGKSQPEAMKLLLEMVKHPLSTSLIMEGIEKGGVKVGGKTEAHRKQNTYTILNRSKDFVRIARDTWALPGWPGVPKQSVKEDEPTDSVLPE